MWSAVPHDLDTDWAIQIWTCLHQYHRRRWGGQISAMFLCLLFPHVSESFNTNQSHTLGIYILPRLKALKAKGFVCLPDHCITSNLTSAWLCSCANNMCWMKRVYSLCDSALLGFPLNSKPFLSPSSSAPPSPYKFSMWTLWSSILDNLTDERIYSNSFKSFTSSLYVQPSSLSWDPGHVQFL